MKGRNPFLEQGGEFLQRTANSVGCETLEKFIANLSENRSHYAILLAKVLSKQGELGATEQLFLRSFVQKCAIAAESRSISIAKLGEISAIFAELDMRQLEKVKRCIASPDENIKHGQDLLDLLRRM